jgi:hypothetical protein
MTIRASVPVMTSLAKHIGAMALVTFMACGLARAQYAIDDADAFTGKMKDMFKQADTPENLEKLIVFCKATVMGETTRKRNDVSRRIPELLKQNKGVEVQEQLRLVREINQQGERLRDVACKPD